MKHLAISFFLLLSALFTCTTSFAQTFDHACYPVEVYATGNRVHVRCQHPEPHFSMTSGPRQVVYFAVPIASPLSNHLAAIASSALANGKWLKVYYSAALGTSFGCLEHDCRPLSSIVMVPYTLTPQPPHDQPVD